MEKSVFIIGRSLRCNNGEIPIIINDSSNTVSNTHCQITVENNNIFIEDLNSTNGTTVNGYKINQPIRIDDNSNVMLGKMVQFHLTHPSIQNVLSRKQKIERVQENNYISDANKGLKKKKQFENIEYASFGQRFIGNLLDGFILSLIITPLLILYFLFTLFTGSLIISIIGTLFLFFAVLVINHLYFAIPISKMGNTIGRRSAGIIYLDEKSMSFPSPGKVWLRLFCYGISSAIFMIGFLMMLGDSKHQALHDKIAGTIVIKSK